MFNYTSSSVNLYDLSLGKNPLEFLNLLNLKDLKFRYPTKKDVQVLKGVSIDIQKNKVIALVGPSGKPV
jgi:ABC-type multidrug transport system fused ATPase/permease subunit